MDGLGPPPQGRGTEPSPPAHADLCAMCYERPKAPGQPYCGQTCANQTPPDGRCVGLWNHTDEAVKVKGSAGFEYNVGCTKVHSVKTNQGEVFKFYTSGGELFGEWTVTKHSIQHAFAELDPTTRQATVRVMVCGAEKGEAAYERCRRQPTTEAVEEIRRKGHRPTIEVVAPLLGLAGCPPPASQRLIDDG